MTHQNRFHQGWQWLWSWMGLMGTPPTLLALVLLTGAGRWTPQAGAQTTNMLSPLEIYEGERLTFTFDTSDTTARTNMVAITAIPHITQTATTERTNNNAWLIREPLNKPTRRWHSRSWIVIGDICSSKLANRSHKPCCMVCFG